MPAVDQAPPASLVCRHLAPRSICPQCIKADIALVEDGPDSEPAPAKRRILTENGGSLKFDNEPPVSAARTLPVTPAERALATCLRAWWDWPGDRADQSAEAHAMRDMGETFKASGLAHWNGMECDLTPAGADLLARVEAAERTPTVVLFAMARAYGDAETAARVVDYQRADRRAAQFHADRDELVCELARIENQGGEPVLFGDLAADYAARLSGATPLDAPPAKEPAR